MHKERPEKRERDRVGKIDALVELRSHFQGRAVEMRDERQQADDEEARDVRSAPLFEQEIDADAQIDQSDQSRVEAALRVRLARLQILQIGEPFVDHGVTLIVEARHLVMEIHRFWEFGLAFDLIEVYLYVLGPGYLIILDVVHADAQKQVAAIDAGERGRAARVDPVGDHVASKSWRGVGRGAPRFDLVSEHINHLDVAPEYAVAVDGLLVQSVAQVERAGGQRQKGDEEQHQRACRDPGHSCLRTHFTMFLPSESQAAAQRPARARAGELHYAVFGAEGLIQQIADVDERFPPQGEPEAGKLLRDVHVDVRVVNAHASGERVDREDKRRRRQADHGRDARARLLGEIQIEFRRGDLEEAASEQLRRRDRVNRRVVEPAAAPEAVTGRSRQVVVESAVEHYAGAARRAVHRRYLMRHLLERRLCLGRGFERQRQQADPMP